MYILKAIQSVYEVNTEKIKVVIFYDCFALKGVIKCRRTKILKLE